MIISRLKLSIILWRKMRHVIGHHQKIRKRKSKPKTKKTIQKNKKDKLCQSALYPFLLIVFFWLFVFFLWKLRNPKSAFFLRKKTKEIGKKQIAPKCFVFVFFLICSFLVCFFPLETPESQICIFPRKKCKNIQKINKKQIAPEFFVFFSMLFFCFFPSGDSRNPNLHFS